MYKVEKAVNSDLKGVYELLEEVNLPIEGIEENFENFFIIKADEAIIGCIGLEIYDKDGLVRSVAINPKFQGKGLGHRLLLRIQKYSLEKGLERLFLLTDTAESFFQKFDFILIPREKIKSGITQSIEYSKLCPSSPILVKEL